MAVAAACAITARHICRPAGRAPGALTRVPFTAVAIDTTGSSRLDEIITIAAVTMRWDGTVLGQFQSPINPGMHVAISSVVRQRRDLSAEMIRSAPPAAEVLARFADFVADSGIVAFDLDRLNRYLSVAYLRCGGQLPAWHGICIRDAAYQHLDVAASDVTELAAAVTGMSGPLYGLQAARATGEVLAALIGRGVSDVVPLPAAKSTPVVQDAPPVTPATAATMRPPAPQAGHVSAADTIAAFGGHSPTDEQRNVIDMFHTGQALKIVAVAGSGKTSTLMAMARIEQRRAPSRRGHIIAFNRSVAEELKRKAPDTVTASTAHALAYRHIRTTAHGPLLAKLDAPRQSWRHIIAAVGAERMWLTTSGRPRPVSDYMVARLGLATVERFCQSVDEQIGSQHVPVQPGIVGDDWLALRDKAVRCARRAWRNLCDPNRGEVRFTPAHYVKLWAHTDPRFGEAGGYLAFDEAQDASPIVRSIVARQTHLQRVYVGDSAQAIYRFTGAVDALESLTDTATATLTQSFRFGQVIADAANVYLGALGVATRVRGNPALTSHISDAAGPVDAVLCRTNADAIATVMAAQRAGTRTAFDGDVAAAMRFCESADRLHQGHHPTDPELMAFSSWADLSDYVDNVPGVSELRVLHDLVDTHGTDTIRETMASLVDRRRAQMTVLTCHKAKGLEFDRVRIDGNWEIDPDGHAGRRDELRDEYRLAYVALTRARRELDPGTLLADTPAEAYPAAAGSSRNQSRASHGLKNSGR